MVLRELSSTKPIKRAPMQVSCSGSSNMTLLKEYELKCAQRKLLIGLCFQLVPNVLLESLTNERINLLRRLIIMIPSHKLSKQSTVLDNLV